MKSNPLYQTKTFWTGVIGIAVMVAGYLLGHVDLGSTIFMVAMCVASIFLRQGLSKEVSDQISAIQKSLTQSKTVYASIFGMAGAAGAYFSGEIELGPAIATVIGGLEIIFLRKGLPKFPVGTMVNKKKVGLEQMYQECINQVISSQDRHRPRETVKSPDKNPKGDDAPPEVLVAALSDDQMGPA